MHKREGCVSNENTLAPPPHLLFGAAEEGWEDDGDEVDEELVSAEPFSQERDTTIRLLQKKQHAEYFYTFLTIRPVHNGQNFFVTYPPLNQFMQLDKYFESVVPKKMFSARFIECFDHVMSAVKLLGGIVCPSIVIRPHHDHPPLVSIKGLNGINKKPTVVEYFQNIINSVSHTDTAELDEWTLVHVHPKKK